MSSGRPNRNYTRREFAKLLIAGSALPLVGCSTAEDENYIEAVARQRALLSESPDVMELVRYATLAANGHNSQPWHFGVRQKGVTILPDLTRRTPVVDPDDHHLFVSLGCAAENFLIASQARGLPGTMAFEESGGGQIHIDLAGGPATEGSLFDAIPARQSTRSVYDGRAASVGDLNELAKAAAANDVDVKLYTDRAEMERVLEFVIAGNSAQIEDPTFVEELRDSIRFNAPAALETGDGLYTACSGNPTMPGWLGQAMFGFFFTKDAENEKYAAQVRSSAGIAVFSGRQESRANWVQVGRSFQRFALKATALGIRHAHINQPVEVPSVRRDFARWLGAGDRRPDLVVRFGYAPPLPMSLRRPVEAVTFSLV